MSLYYSTNDLKSSVQLCPLIITFLAVTMMDVWIMILRLMIIDHNLSMIEYSFVMGYDNLS